MSQKRKRSPERHSSANDDSTSIFRSSPIEDRISIFVGYFSPSLKPKQLQSLEEIASASHKMLAWRRASNQQSISGGTKYVSDHDDDGEKYGGKRVEKSLQSMQVVGVCVVARWYGGVLLGPVRFDHIETCAREAIEKWRESEREAHAKKRKAEEDASEMTRLIKVLADRDQSIAVLRSLAAEKEDKLKEARESQKNGERDGDGGGGQAARDEKVNARVKQKADEPKPALDYDAVPIDRLKALEKARDATLSFLLKRIDKAEVELATITGENPEPS